LFKKLRVIFQPWVLREGMRHPEVHRAEGGLLREVVFGANDGLVSNISLVAGLVGATTDAKMILLGGVAGIVAGAISMGLGAYISSKSEREFRDAEEARERWEIVHMRDAELAETREIFRRKGLEDPLLEEVVATVARNNDQWVQIMMTDELGFPHHPPKPRVSAIVMGLAFGIAAIFPVAPFLFWDGTTGFVLATVATGVALLAVSGWRAYLTGGHAVRKSFEMIGLAAIAVVIANLVGRLVGIGIY
jgi:VIT1/CCC1 family predicted Fe2+/Mn2+ transporter